MSNEERVDRFNQTSLDEKSEYNTLINRHAGLPLPPTTAKNQRTANITGYGVKSLFSTPKSSVKPQTSRLNQDEINKQDIEISNEYNKKKHIRIQPHDIMTENTAIMGRKTSTTMMLRQKTEMEMNDSKNTSRQDLKT